MEENNFEPEVEETAPTCGTADPVEEEVTPACGTADPAEEEVAPACGTADPAEEEVAPACGTADPAPVVSEKKPFNALALVGLILGVGSLLLGWLGLIPIFVIVPLAVAIVALVLSVLGKKKAKTSGSGKILATIGLVFSIIALVISACLALIAIVSALIAVIVAFAG